MITCPACGTGLADDTVVCPVCGLTLTAGGGTAGGKTAGAPESSPTPTARPEPPAAADPRYTLPRARVVSLHSSDDRRRSDGTPPSTPASGRTGPAGPSGGPPPGSTGGPPPGSAGGPTRRVTALTLAGLLLAGVAAGTFWLLDGLRPGGSGDSETTRAAPTLPEDDAADDLTSLAHATAEKTAPATRDQAGRTVSYAASRLLDGDPRTTWRMVGDGTGVSITFTLDRPVTITRVGLINGWADSRAGGDRYLQERRVTAVTWTVGSVRVRQRLREPVRSLQYLDVGPVTARRITLTLDEVTDPGPVDPHDFTAVSEVRLLGR